MPVQESGTLPSRPLPYQPNAGSAVICGSERISIAMTNAGTESVHFMVFPNAYRSDGPWQNDVGPSNSVSDSFSVHALNGGLYDLISI
jgi:phospholipase C